MNIKDFKYVCQDPNGEVNIYINKPEFSYEKTIPQWIYGSGDMTKKPKHICIGITPIHQDHQTTLISILPDLRYSEVIKETFKGFTSLVDLL